MSEGRISQVQEILDREGWKYERENNAILLLASFLSRKWKMVIDCEGESRVCCFSVFPWAVPENKIADILGALNELNLAQRIGCFILNTADRRVVYRCGIRILDEYTSYDYIKYVLLSNTASVNANWETIYSLIFNSR